MQTYDYQQPSVKAEENEQFLVTIQNGKLMLEPARLQDGKGKGGGGGGCGCVMFIVNILLLIIVPILWSVLMYFESGYDWQSYYKENVDVYGINCILLMWLWNFFYLTIGHGRCYNIFSAALNFLAAIMIAVWFFYYYVSDIKSGEVDYTTHFYKLRMAYAVLGAFMCLFFGFEAVC